jgi:hypothetical protein
MPDLPQIVVPALLYNLTLCALSAAAAWHLVSGVSNWVKNRSTVKNRSSK